MTTLKAKQVTLLPTNTSTVHMGQFSGAYNVGSIASGNGAHAEGAASLAGQVPIAFTIPAGGTLVTVAGNQTAQFELTQTVRIIPTAPKTLPVESGIVNSAPAFAAGSTTFNLAAPIDSVTTGGTIVLSSSATRGRGRAAHAEGDRTIALGVCSHSEGGQTLACGPGGHAEGAGSFSYGNGAHAEGEVTTAGGTDAHTEGIGSYALGFAAHAEGNSVGPTAYTGCCASGDGSHSEGYSSRAGNNVRQFTIAAGGITVTLPGGNFVSEFIVGHRIPFIPTVPTYGSVLYATIATQPVYNSGPNTTTFDLTASLGVIGILDPPGVGATTTGGYTVDGQVGYAAHAEGGGCIASSNYAHAEGRLTVASGLQSHSEGVGCIASGDDSHAEGANTVAFDTAAHAEGSTSTANAQTSHAEGDGTRTGNPLRTFTIAAGGVLVTIAGDVTAEFTNGDALSISVTTPVVIPRVTKTVASVPAFAAGNTTFNLSSAIDPTATGGQIFDNAKSRGGAHAEGFHTIATGARSHAEGDTTIASGLGSHAEGGGTTSSNTYSHAEGGSSVASGQFTHAEGNTCTANASAAHAEGQNTLASGFDSHAEGFSTTAGGSVSHAEGNACVANGINSHAEGLESKTLRDNRYAQAGGKFSVVGDNQYERVQVRGSTPGSAAGEITTLRTGAAVLNALENLTSYAITLRAVARKMATGAAASQDIFFYKTFIASVNNAGAVTITAVTDVMPPIINGAAFVGATLIPSSSATNDLTLTFAIAAGLTIASRITASVEMVELVGT